MHWTTDHEGAAVQIEQHATAAGRRSMPFARAPGQGIGAAADSARRQGDGGECAQYAALRRHGHRRPHQAAKEQTQKTAQQAAQQHLLGGWGFE
ncbi:hypothetical protein, partial [Escherichia coli]